jgi:hypothetical protein
VEVNNRLPFSHVITTGSPNVPLLNHKHERVIPGSKFQFCEPFSSYYGQSQIENVVGFICIPACYLIAHALWPMSLPQIPYIMHLCVVHCLLQMTSFLDCT